MKPQSSTPVSMSKQWSMPSLAPTYRTLALVVVVRLECVVSRPHQGRLP